MFNNNFRATIFLLAVLFLSASTLLMGQILPSNNYSRHQVDHRYSSANFAPTISVFKQGDPAPNYNINPLKNGVSLVLTPVTGGLEVRAMLGVGDCVPTYLVTIYVQTFVGGDWITVGMLTDVPVGNLNNIDSKSRFVGTFPLKNYQDSYVRFSVWDQIFGDYIPSTQNCKYWDGSDGDHMFNHYQIPILAFGSPLSANTPTELKNEGVDVQLAGADLVVVAPKGASITVYQDNGTRKDFTVQPSAVAQRPAFSLLGFGPQEIKYVWTSGSGISVSGVLRSSRVLPSVFFSDDMSLQ